jgi:hypothetical protein
VSFVFVSRASPIGMGSAQENSVDNHWANLLAATQQQFEKELSSCAACGASPVVGDDAVAEPEPEQDSQGCSVDLETPESRAPVVYDACRLGGKKRRLVTVQDYQWKIVSQQLLDYKGTETMYPVEESTKTTGISGGRGG